MKLRLPLYARILGLFLLNILVLAVAFLVVFRMQFHLGLDSFLAGQANRRVRALSDVVIRELQGTPIEDLDTVISRFSESFGLGLYVFRVNGDQLAGKPVELPPEVHRILRRAIPGRGWGGPPASRPGLQLEAREAQPPPVEPDAEAGQTRPPDDVSARPAEAAVEPSRQPPLGRGPFGRGRGLGPGPRGPQGAGRFALPPSFFIRSSEPTRYWAGTFFPSREPGSAGQPQVLLIASDSITGGGLFLDFTPWIAAGCGALLLSALIWLPFVRNITRSLGRMTRATADISVGRFEARVPTGRSDELGQLSEAINEMAGRLEGYVNGQRQFLGDIAHELCSPLARIQTALGILDQRTGVSDRSYLKDLQEEAEQMSQLVGELLSFSKASMRRSSIPLAPVPVADVVGRAVRREQVESALIRQSVPENLVAETNAELLQRAVANLLRNAVRHAGPAGPITLEAWQEGDAVVLEVADRGPGVPEESLPKLFDPFYRVDPSRARETGGVGLGMTIVKTCVESCRGTVSAANRPEGGLAVRIRLKASPSATLDGTPC